MERRGGIVTIKPIIDAISRVEVSTDKTAAELALRRLHQELQNHVETRQRTTESAAQATQDRDRSLGALLIGIIVLAIVAAAAFNSWLAIIPFVIAAFLVARNSIATTKMRDVQLRKELVYIDSKIDEVKRKIDKNRTIVDS